MLEPIVLETVGVRAVVGFVALLLEACGSSLSPPPARVAARPVPPPTPDLVPPRRADVAREIMADEIACRHDLDCDVVTVPPDNWCWDEGFALSVRADRAAGVRERIASMGSSDEDMLCPTAVPRCRRGGCALDFEWKTCERDADCVRIVFADVPGAPPVNACRRDAADLLARDLMEQRVPYELASDGVACRSQRCRLPGEEE